MTTPGPEANTDAAEALPRLADQLRRLADAVQTVTDGSSFEELLETVMRHAVEGSAASSGVLVIRHGNVVEIVASSGFSADVIDRFTPLPLDAALPITESVRSGESVLSPSRADRLRRFPAAARQATDVEGTAAIPLRFAGRVLGALGVTWPAPHTLDEHDRRFLSALAALAAEVVARRRAERDASKHRALWDSGALGMLEGEGEVITDANDEFLRIVGRERSAIAGGLTWRELTPPEHLAADERRVDDVRTGRGESLAKEYWLPDGRRIPVDVAGNAISSDPFRWVAAVFDTSDAERLRAMAETEAAIVATLLESAPVGFALLDEELRFQRVNPRFAELAGRGVEEHLGRGLFELLPTGRDRAEPLLRAVIETGEALVDVELVGSPPAPGHTRSWAESVFPVRRHDGSTVGLAVVATDVSERRQLERQLADLGSTLDVLLMAAPIGIALFDGERRFVRVNDALAALNAIPASAHLGRRVDEMIPDDAGRTMDGWIAAVLATGEPITERELSGSNSAGADLEVVAHYYPIHREGGEVGGVGVVVIDVTERNRLQRAAQSELQRRIADQDAALDQLQRMLLPPLPDVPSLVTEAAYQPAGSVARVGGDWYDCFTLADGRVVIAVGDAAGHGVSAVRTMSLARNVVRGLLLTGAGLAETLAATSQTLAATPEYATAALAVFDPATGRLDYALAGHPPPVVRRADGRTAVLPLAGGPLLGLVRGFRYGTGATDLGRDDTVLLYTDGLVERRGEVSIDAGIGRVAQALADGPRPPVPLAPFLLGRALQGSTREDDICLLLATRR